jgi:mannose/fructose/N-acetylgalactosamine-specific phosphotransferase system component IID
MEYAAIALAILGFVVGIQFRLQVLLVVIALLLFSSVVYSFSSGLSWFDGLLTIMAAQTVIQGSYFLGLMVRAAFESHDPQHIL